MNESSYECAPNSCVLCCSELNDGELERLLSRYAIRLTWVSDSDAILASYWGESEAGLKGNVLYVRGDTPLHSALHEACHYVCMPAAKRVQVDTDAGGDYDEENAVCYLQIVLSDRLNLCSKKRMMADMDAWGYTFRLGSAQRWFDTDASDAQQWLQKHRLIDEFDNPTWTLR